MEGCKVSNGEVGEASVEKVGGKIPPVLKIRVVSLAGGRFFLGRTCERTCIFEEPAGAGRTAAERGGATEQNICVG